MSEKKISANKISGLSQLILVGLSLIGFLIAQFAVGKEKLGFAPIWMLFMVYFVGGFILGLTTGLVKRSALSVFFGGISGVIGLEIILFCVANIKYWYVWIVIGLVLLVMVFIAVYVMKSDKLTIEFDNRKHDLKKAAAEKEKTEKLKAEGKEEKEELPEIKSFKD